MEFPAFDTPTIQVWDARSGVVTGMDQKSKGSRCAWEAKRAMGNEQCSSTVMFLIQLIQNLLSVISGQCLLLSQCSVAAN